nr:hypothetical protein [Tanacetum cinerariifolium]
EDSVKEDVDADDLAYIEADAMAVEATVDKDVEARVDADIGMEVDVNIDVEDEVEDEVESSDKGTMEVRVDVVVGIDIPEGMLMPDAVERLEQVKEGLKDIYDHVIEIPLQRIKDINITEIGLATPWSPNKPPHGRCPTWPTGMSTVKSTNGNVLLGRIRIHLRRRISDGATKGASGNSDDGATTVDGAGKMGAIRISEVEVVGNDDRDATLLLHLVSITS